MGFIKFESWHETCYNDLCNKIKYYSILEEGISQVQCLFSNTSSIETVNSITLKEKDFFLDEIDTAFLAS